MERSATLGSKRRVGPWTQVQVEVLISQKQGEHNCTIIIISSEHRVPSEKEPVYIKLWGCLIKYSNLRSKCQSKLGTCHLPLQGLKHVLLQLLVFKTSWKEFRMENRNEALGTWGKAGRAGLQIDTFWRQFYEPSSCISSYLQKH